MEKFESFPRSKTDKKRLEKLSKGYRVEIVQVKSKNGWIVSKAIFTGGK